MVNYNIYEVILENWLMEGQKKRRLWSDAMRHSRPLVRAWNFCHIGLSTKNTFLAFCAILKHMSINIRKRLI